jgi:RNA polymerase sigma factor (TIGR02999 family)
MSPEDSGSVTNLLGHFHRGDPTVEAKLMMLVRDELHRLAYMRRERPDHTLQPTALINEAYIRLVNQSPKLWKNRSHFLAVSALLMRQILVDHARARLTGKRGKRAVHVSVDDADVSGLLIHDREQAEDLIALHDALNKLETIDPRQSRILHLRFFGGLSVKEAANVWRFPRGQPTGSRRAPGTGSRTTCAPRLDSCVIPAWAKLPTGCGD